MRKLLLIALVFVFLGCALPIEKYQTVEKLFPGADIRALPASVFVAKKPNGEIWYVQISDLGSTIQMGRIW